jgi:hypothetical protein
MIEIIGIAGNYFHSIHVMDFGSFLPIQKYEH